MTTQNYCTAVDMYNLKRKKKTVLVTNLRTGTADIVYGFGEAGDEGFC